MITRQQIRERIYNLIVGIETAETTKFQTVSFEGKSPVIHVISAGTRRTGMFKGMADIQMRFNINVFVLHSDNENTWTTQDAEDQIDQIDNKIGEVLSLNQECDLWRGVYWDSSSQIQRVTVSGVPYLFESIPLIVEVK